MTDTQILHKANGILRIRECCKRAWIELNSNLITVRKVGGFIIKVDESLNDNEFYFINETPNHPTQIP